MNWWMTFSSICPRSLLPASSSASSVWRPLRDQDAGAGRKG